MSADSQVRVNLAREATEALREMIVRRQLTGREQIRQADIAERLSLSRSPVREALHALESEGLVRHEPNRGYFVAEPSAQDLREIYRMRELIETELFSEMEVPTETQLMTLAEAERAVEVAVADGALGRMLAANSEFHARIFELSRLRIMVAEAKRLWNMAAPFQATYVWLPGNLERILADHDQILEALAKGDRTRLIEKTARHRDAAASSVLDALSSQERQ